jgi:hypothetical protein
MEEAQKRDSSSDEERVIIEDEDVEDSPTDTPELWMSERNEDDTKFVRAEEMLFRQRNECFFVGIASPPQKDEKKKQTVTQTCRSQVTVSGQGFQKKRRSGQVSGQGFQKTRRSGQVSGQGFPVT